MKISNKITISGVIIQRFLYGYGNSVVSLITDSGPLFWKSCEVSWTLFYLWTQSFVFYASKDNFWWVLISSTHSTTEIWVWFCLPQNESTTTSPLSSEVVALAWWSWLRIKLYSFVIASTVLRRYRPLWLPWHNPWHTSISKVFASRNSPNA